MVCYQPHLVRSECSSLNNTKYGLYSQITLSNPKPTQTKVREFQVLDHKIADMYNGAFFMVEK